MNDLYSKTVYPLPEYLIEKYDTIDVEVGIIMYEEECQFRRLHT